MRLVKDIRHDTATNEDFVSLFSLATVLKDHLRQKESTSGFESTHGNSLAHDHSKMSLSKQSTQDISSTKNNTFDIECVYVDSDQFYLEENFSGRDPKSKSIRKVTSTCNQRMESHLERLFSSSVHSEGCIVLTVHLPFLVLRDFGSAAMLGNSETIVSCVSETVAKYSQHRKTLKTLSRCLDHLIRRQLDSRKKSIDKNKRGSSNLFCAIIYSIEDDKFDLFQRVC